MGEETNYLSISENRISSEAQREETYECKDHNIRNAGQGPRTDRVCDDGVDYIVSPSGYRSEKCGNIITFDELPFHSLLASLEEIDHRACNDDI